MTALRQMKDLLLFLSTVYLLCQVHCRPTPEKNGHVRSKANPKPVKKWTPPPTTTANPPTTTANPPTKTANPPTTTESPPTTLPTTTPPITTTRPTTTHCPYPCTFRGQHYCEPLLLRIKCVDAVRPPGGCAYECPNGPNCRYQDTVIPEGQNATMAGGEVVFCSEGDLHGGRVTVYPVG